MVFFCTFWTGTSESGFGASTVQGPQEPSAILLCGFNSTHLAKERHSDGGEAWLKENIMTMLKHTYMT